MFVGGEGGLFIFWIGPILFKTQLRVKARIKSFFNPNYPWPFFIWCHMFKNVTCFFVTIMQCKVLVIDKLLITWMSNFLKMELQCTLWQFECHVGWRVGNTRKDHDIMNIVFSKHTFGSWRMVGEFKKHQDNKKGFVSRVFTIVKSFMIYEKIPWNIV